MKKKINWVLILKRRIFLLFIFLSYTSLSFSQTSTWDGGGGNNNWTTANNWVGDTIPVSSSNLQLIFQGTTRLTAAANVTNPWVAHSITFSNNAGGFTVSSSGGVPIQLWSGITNNSTNTQTISAPLHLSNSISIFNEDGFLTLSGVVSGGNGLTKSGTNRLTLSGNSTYSGGLTIDEGIVLLNNANAGGTGTIILNSDGRLVHSVNAVITNAVTLEGGMVQVNGGNRTFSNGIWTVNGDVVFNLGDFTTASTARQIILRGPLTGNGSITTTNTATGQYLHINPTHSSNYTFSGSYHAGTNAQIRFSLGETYNVVSDDFNYFNFTNEISGHGTVTFNPGSGRAMVLRNASARTGTTVVTGGGFLVIEDHEALGNGPVFMGESANAANRTFLLLGGNINFEGSVYYTQMGSGNRQGFGADNGENYFNGVLSLAHPNADAGIDLFLRSGSIMHWGGDSDGLYTPGATNLSQLRANGYDGAIIDTRVNSSNFQPIRMIGGGTLVIDANFDPLAWQDIVDNVYPQSDVNMGFGGRIEVLDGKLIIGNTNRLITLYLASTTNTPLSTIRFTVDRDYDDPISVTGTRVTEGKTYGNIFQGNIQVDNGVTVNMLKALGGSSPDQIINKTGAGIFNLRGPLANLSSQGSLFINDGIFRIETANITNNSTYLTVNPIGVFDLNGYDVEVGSLAGTGSVLMSNATLTVGRNHTNTLWAGLISGSGSFIKTGTGTMTMSSPNAYTGLTTISNGVIIVTHDKVFGETNQGTVVVDGAALGFQDDVVYSALENLTISGSGITNTGVIRSYSGNNTFAGDILMTGDSAIGSDVNILTLSGVLNNGGFGLTTVGAGQIVFAGQIAGTGGFTNSNTGEVTLSASNLFTGQSLVQSGLLSVTADGALGSTSAGTLVSNGASLGFKGGVDYTLQEALEINGSGFDGQGALQNLLGNNSFDGDITLGTNASIGAILGELTLNGEMNNSGHLLTFSGGGNTVVNAGIGGGGGLLKLGLGDLSLTASNTFTGALTNNEGAVVLKDSGSIRHASEIVVSGGNLTLDNSVTNLNDRIGDGIEITLGGGVFGGGTILLIGNASADTIETVGTVVLESGESVIQLSPGSPTQSVELYIEGSGLIRVGSGTIDFTPTSGTLGSVGIGPKVFIDNGLGLLVGNIIPFAVVNGIFATYDATYGVRQMTDFWLGFDNDEATINENVRPDGFDHPMHLPPLTANVEADDVINSLVLDSGINVELYTNTLNIASGALAKLGASSSTLSNGFLTAGYTNSEDFKISVEAGSTLNILSEIIDNGSGVVSLTKSGDGTLVLAEVNSYTGTNTLNKGVIQISEERNLGDLDNLVRFNSGVLQITESFTASSGKVFDVVASSTGVLDIDPTKTLSLTNPGNLRSGNHISVLVKQGEGTLLISAPNTNFTGTVRIDEGSVDLRHQDALGIAGGKAQIDLNGGTLALINDVSTDFANPLILSADSGIYVDRVSSGSGQIHSVGNITMYAHTLTIDGDHGASVSIAGGTLLGDATLNTATANALIGAINGEFDLNKDGVGVLTLTGVNTYAGQTIVRDGTLRLGDSERIPNGSALILSNTATFDLDGYNETVGSLSGGGNVLLGGNTNSFFSAGFNNSDTLYSGIISGSGSFIKSGTGTLTISGQHTYTGRTEVAGGTLLWTGGNDRIVTNSYLVVGLEALADLNGYTQTVERVRLLGGTIDSGASGLLRVYGDITNRDIETAPTIVSSYINGNLELASPQPKFDIGDGVPNEDLIVNAFVFGTNGLQKNGLGLMSLTASNDYSGLTDIQNGTLRARNDWALGQGGGTNNGTYVFRNAELQLQGDITITNETLILNAAGVTGEGALRNVSGTNYWNGTITLESASTIGSDADLLFITANIVNSSNNLNFTGSGDSRVTGVIGDGSGNLSKSGLGTLYLNQSNTYTGETSINGGVLSMENKYALGGLGKGTLVNGGGTLRLSSNLVFDAGEKLTIHGDGASGQGALSQKEGTNQWTTLINLGAASKISSLDGLLTLSGNISNHNNNLTIGGGGETLISGQIRAGSSLVREGSGTLTLAAANELSGQILIKDSGTIRVSHNGALGSADNTITRGTLVTDQATLALSNNTIINEYLVLSGSGSSQSGALRHLGGTSLWSGDIYLGAATNGTFPYAQSNIAPAAATILVDAGSLDLAGQVTGGDLRKTGPGTLVLGGSSNVFGNLTADGGQTLISGLKTNHLQNVTVGESNSQATLTLQGGAKIYSQNSVIGLESGAGSNSVSVSGPGTLWSNIGSVVVSSNQALGNSLTIEDQSTLHAGSLTVKNNGRLTMSNASILSTTTIENGASFFAIGQATNSGNVNFSSSASIANFSTNEIFTINGGGNFTNAANLTIHTPGGTSGTSNMFSGIETLGGAFTNTGTITWSFDTEIDYNNTASWSNPYIGGMRSTTDIFTPYLQSGLGSEFVSGFNISGLNLPTDRYFTAIFYADYYYLVVIPEPRTYALLMMGAICILLVYRRKRVR